MTTRRQLRTTVEIEIEKVEQLICTPKRYRDESYATECAKTQEMPAIGGEEG
jgi:hypothetical protein